MESTVGEPVAGKDRLIFGLAHRDMPDQSCWREKYLFQSMALHALARGRVGAGHDKGELGAVIADAAVFCYFPMRIRETPEEFDHHHVNGLAAAVFAKKGGMIRGVSGEQRFDAGEIACVR